MKILKRIINVIKNNKEFILMVCFVFATLYLAHNRSYSEGYYFVTGGDVRTQWYEFYTINRRETINALRGGVFPFYSWVTFLGTNIWAAHASYGLFDIFNILTYTLDLDYYVIYDIQCYAKIVIGVISFYFLIHSIYKDKKISAIMGICYGLSSFAIYFQSQPGFLSFFALMPLYFLALENYLTKRRMAPFAFITFLLFLTNYYLFFSVTLFTPIYFIYRYYNIHKTLKGLIPDALKAMAVYCVGFLMASIVILPTILYITQSERVGGFGGSLAFDDLNMYLHLLLNSFLPSHTYIYGNDIFNRAEHTLKEICMYAGCMIPIINAQVLVDKNKTFKYSTLLLYLVLLLLLFIPYGNSIMQGFSEPCFRWVILIVMMNLIVASKYLSNFKDINIKALIITVIVVLIAIPVLYMVAIFHKSASIFDYKTQFMTLTQILALIITITLAITFKKKKILFLLLLVELSYFTYKANSSYGYGGTKDDFKNVRKVLSNDNDYHELEYYLNGLEENNSEEFFRTYIPYDSLYWSYSKNFNLIYNIKGLMSYSSTTAPSFSDMKYIDVQDIVGLIDWEYDIKDSNLIDFYATKYAITTTEEEIPFENYEIITSDYRGGLIVSKNSNYTSLGRTYNKTMTNEEFNKQEKDTSLLLDYVISDEINYNIHADRNILENISHFNNSLRGECTTQEDTLMVLSLPYDDGWKIIVNGIETEYHKVNGGNICFSLNKGYNYIEMYFIPEGFKIGTSLTVMGFVLIILLFVNDKKTMKLKKLD